MSRLTTTLLCAACAGGRGWCWGNRRLRHRQPGFIRLETRDTDVVIPLKVKLEVSDFQRITTAVFGQTARKVCNRVDKLVRNVE